MDVCAVEFGCGWLWLCGRDAASSMDATCIRVARDSVQAQQVKARDYFVHDESHFGATSKRESRHYIVNRMRSIIDLTLLYLFSAAVLCFGGRTANRRTTGK